MPIKTNRIGTQNCAPVLTVLGFQVLRLHLNDYNSVRLRELIK